MLYKTVVLLCTLVFTAASIDGTAAEKTESPRSAGGFTLGTSIDNYSFIRQENFVEEIAVSGIKGFRKGFVTYGTCYRPGEILRIRLKYLDESDRFFQKLLKKFKDTFGPGPKFVGDPFGKVKAWKWEFKLEDGRRVTLTLQHNLENDEESIGNMIKIGLPDQLIAERECSNKISVKKDEGTPGKMIIEDWDLLLPQ